MNLEGSWYLFCRLGMYPERFLVSIPNFGIISLSNTCFLPKTKLSSARQNKQKEQGVFHYLYENKPRKPT